MKLVYCPECQDIVRLFEEPRTCACGAVSGHYLDNSLAEISGPGIPIGILNEHLRRAIERRTDEWPGVWFEGFVIPRNAENVIRTNGTGT